MWIQSQVKDWNYLLSNFNLSENKHIAFTGGFNLFLDYWCERRLQTFRKWFKKAEILGTIPMNNSPVFCSIQKINSCTKESRLWKFNNSLVSNEKYIEKIKQRIQKIKENLSRENQFCDQIKWKILLE